MEENIVKAALAIKAIKLQPSKPFTWASGFSMPIYNDNRRFMFHPDKWNLIVDGFQKIAKEFQPEVIVGVATGGIPWGVLLASKLGIPFAIGRGAAKNHGIKAKVHGPEGGNLKGIKVLIIEDLISTGGSLGDIVKVVREANGNVVCCASIFSYGFDKSKQLFEELKVPVRPLFTYDELIQVVEQEEYFDESQCNALKEWRQDPFGWGEKHGFPRK